MSIEPIISFKAGVCELDTGFTPPKVKCQPTPGYIYLYTGEDELLHFCWRARSKLITDPDLDLIMFPGDATFHPYTGREGGNDPEEVTSPTNGRIYVLKFSSSSLRHLFWFQSLPQEFVNVHSERDLKIGQIVDLLLAGEEVDVQAELGSLSSHGHGRHDPDDEDDGDDEEMEDAPPANPRPRGNSTGGAGAGATGGDVREEGEQAREGGADGGRAAAPLPTDASSLVQNFLNSLKSGGGGGSARQTETPFATLAHLFNAETCLPVISKLSSAELDTLLRTLPPELLLLSQESAAGLDEPEPDASSAAAALEALSTEQKREIVTRVVRSPQFHQSLDSLTIALREGGLPSVAEGLGIRVANGGFVRGGSVPLGGGEAVQAFIEGIKETVKKETEEERMDTS
ncbi:hypothetical protein EJ06DRAFT_504686 [Trichodelitschia bisporula]|uniref:Pru domain-containing protein n=1 Tax=Trichodelitschia bisporula TaxID=703511 RepID=A0A6G1I5S2_9PEZI|nr:hypothetical protein EJ06DRAFT_504686 [Trichodelitschia bisporula]